MIRMCLWGLITVINPDYTAPGKAVLKTKANDYKSCKISTGQYLPFGEKLTIDVFDQRVRNNFPIRISIVYLCV